MRKANKTAIGRCKGIYGLIVSATWKEAEYGTTSIGGGVKPSFARMANANCLSRGPAREEKK